MRLEILTGWKRRTFAQAIYTQRREFRAGSVNLRPGGLLSLRQRGDTVFHNLLFLHTDSGTGKKDYSNRQTMFGKNWSLKAALAGLSGQGGRAKLLAVGDFNTMGRSRSWGVARVPAGEELASLATAANAAGMRFLTKSSDQTWSNASESKSSDLDHALASNDLRFQEYFFVDDPTTTFELEVDGWNRFEGAQRGRFIEDISDHCALAGSVI